MDLRDGPEEARLREHLRTWLERTLPRLPSPADASPEERGEIARRWQRLLHEGGWTGLSWPEEYGGRGLGSVHEAILSEELARFRAPLPVNWLGMLLAGPTILDHGTPEQCARYLPPILSGDEVWCQGFSEPDAGSDLAGLRTRAEPEDGGWRVHGQKVWTSFGHLADRCMLLARTDPTAPKHRGLTYFLADMSDVEVRPLVLLNGDRHFNEMFFDGVFVSSQDILGTLHDGWRCAVTTLTHERANGALVLQVWASQALADLVAQVRSLGLQSDLAVLADLGRFSAEVDALRLSAARAASELAAGRAPDGAAEKLQWSRSTQEMLRYGLALAGPSAVEAETGGHLGSLDRYLEARGHSIAGGTDEVLLSLIAERHLDLPRSR